MNRKILKIIVVLAIANLGGWAQTVTVDAQHEGHGSPVQDQQTIRAKSPVPAHGPAVYYCPMHPSYTSDRPGDCPICNMSLVKKEEAQAANPSEDSAVAQDDSFYISPEKQQLIGVKSEKIIPRPLSKVIRTVGRVAFDPALFASQTEYLEARKILGQVRDSGEGETVRRAQALVDAARIKLRLQGLDEKQIEDLGAAGQNDLSLLLSSQGAGHAWIYATIYEYEMGWLHPGQKAVITSVAYPDQTFSGETVAVDTVFDAATRSVRARIKVEDSQGRLKPDMFVDVEMASDLGTHLAVPREAIMDTGTRKIVFLQLENGRIRPAEIRTGLSNEDYTQVLSGVSQGDAVVVSGNFLIDSESKLKAALESAGHQHAP